jgi:cytochrome c-type biogenesis protein
LVNIWGTWCPPCREEFPHIVELYRHYRDRPRFSLLAVSTSGGDDDDVDALRAATLEFLDQQKASDLPTYVDPGKKTREAIGAIVGMVVYPTTVLVDAQGRVRGHWIGYRTGTEREMSLLIDHLLAE